MPRRRLYTILSLSKEEKVWKMDRQQSKIEGRGWQSVFVYAKYLKLNRVSFVSNWIRNRTSCGCREGSRARKRSHRG